MAASAGPALNPPPLSPQQNRWPGSVVVDRQRIHVVIVIIGVRDIDDYRAILEDIADLDIYPCRKFPLFCAAVRVFDIRPHAVAP